MTDWSRALSAHPAADPAAPLETVTGNRGLQIEEGLIFEQGSPGRCGVDFADPAPFEARLGGLERRAEIGLPGLSEPQVMRHFTRLSQKNYAIDTGLYPLGSCTMKHNPAAQREAGAAPGFCGYPPASAGVDRAGALALIDTLAHWLKTLTGMPAIALSPGAGAHGELCGMMTIRAALEARGERRSRVLVPESAHGTNPATAAACGYAIDPVPGNPQGRVDLDALRRKLGPDVAALMLTNPNTCGLFENEILDIAAAVHAAGAFFYCDGANFNAIVGRVRPADLGIDCMHLNLHKTFSTPHGGGGPGSGPVALAASLAPYAPLPWARARRGWASNWSSIRSGPAEHAIGRLKGFHGQMGMFVRALAYMMSHGADGLRQVAEDAVLNANYLRARLDGDLSLSFPGPCMHEVLFDDRFLKDTGVTTLDFAKALIDEGYHPMTMYFPLVVHGALLIEPTETESKASLDQFAAVLKALAAAARSGDAARFHAAPRLSPRRRLDETAAARRPILRWRPAPARREAAQRIRIAAEMSPNRIRLSVSEAREHAERAMRGIGYDQEEARIVADHAIDAALCGLRIFGAGKAPQHPRASALQTAAPADQRGARNRTVDPVRRRQQRRHAGDVPRHSSGDRQGRGPRHCDRRGYEQLDERPQRLLCRDDRQCRAGRDPHRGFRTERRPARRHACGARHQPDRLRPPVVAWTNRLRHGNLGIHGNRFGIPRASGRAVAGRGRDRWRRAPDTRSRPGAARRAAALWRL